MCLCVSLQPLGRGMQTEKKTRPLQLLYAEQITWELAAGNLETMFGKCYLLILFLHLSLGINQKQNTDYCSVLAQLSIQSEE